MIPSGFLLIIYLVANHIKVGNTQLRKVLLVSRIMY